MLVKSVSALAPQEEAQTWSGADWLRPPAWALRGTSLYSVIFRPELYVFLEHGDDEDGEPIDAIRTLLPFKPRGHEKKRPIPTANQLGKQNGDDEAEKEAARLAKEKGASQEQLLEWSKGRPTRSRKTKAASNVRLHRSASAPSLSVRLSRPPGSTCWEKEMLRMLWMQWILTLTTHLYPENDGYPSRSLP
jgi:hypothetical protein